MGEVGRLFASFGIIHHHVMHATFFSNIHPASHLRRSEAGNGAVSYLLLKCGENVTTSFVMSKCRVAPIHHLTIPRMELSAALLGTRLVQKIKREPRLKIDFETYWSDSSTVLRWIYSTHCRYHTWVANRVGEILTLTYAKQWRHVLGVLNPADDCSRGVEAASLREDNRWWTGYAKSAGQLCRNILSRRTTTPKLIPQNL